ncbi:MAG: restriction endonuclease subunit S [Oscillospiraceae bacterium]|nr:restriction endonuclease subunit S [Oscillospiraceae bacterium]
MTISYYEKMPDGKLRCLDDELPFELPDSWEWCNMSMIGTTNIGLTYRPTDIEPNGVVVLRFCNIVNDQLDLSDLVRVQTGIRENQFAQKNDILICARNGSKALVGKCTLIPALGEPASFGAFMAIYRTEFFEYIVHYLRSNYFRSVFDDGNSTAINQLTQDMLKRAVVPLPPLSEQYRIAEAIKTILSELNEMEKSLN